MALGSESGVPQDCPEPSAAKERGPLGTLRLDRCECGTFRRPLARRSTPSSCPLSSASSSCSNR